VNQSRTNSDRRGLLVGTPSISPVSVPYSFRSHEGLGEKWRDAEIYRKNDIRPRWKRDSVIVVMEFGRGREVRGEVSSGQRHELQDPIHLGACSLFRAIAWKGSQFQSCHVTRTVPTSQSPNDLCHLSQCSDLVLL
jgi:hypothetical protein